MENAVAAQNTQENTEWLKIREKILNTLSLSVGSNFFITIPEITPLLNIGQYCHYQENLSKLLNEKIELFSKIDLNKLPNFSTNLYNDKKFLDAFENVVGTELFQQFKGDVNIPWLYDKISEKQKYQINSLIVAHSLKYKPLIKKLLKHISYNNYFFIQGLTNLNFHFENCKNNIMFSDQHRNSLNDNKEIKTPLLTKSSRYMTVMFYNHKYWDSSIPPKNQEIEFWIALDSLLNKNQSNYISQITNANENELTPDQKNLRDQLNNLEIQNKIIDFVKNSYPIKFNNIETTNYKKDKNPFKIEIEKNDNTTGRKIIVNMNKSQFAHIMNSDESSLNKYEKNFKYYFLNKVATVHDLKKIEFPAGPEITIDNLIEKDPQLNFLNHLNNPTLISSQIKIDSKNPVENITVTSAEKLHDFSDIKREIEEIENQDVTDILFEFEKNNVEFKYWCPLHQIHQIHQITDGKWPNFTTRGNGFLKAVSNGELNNNLANTENASYVYQAINLKLSMYSKDKQIKIIRKFIANSSLQPETKKQILMQYSQLPGSGFIKALAKGELELNQETSKYFLEKIFSLYKNNSRKATRLKTKILNDPKTTEQFREFLNTMDFMALIPTFLTLYASYSSTALALINTNLTIASVAASCYYASLPATAFALTLNQQNNQQLIH